MSEETFEVREGDKSQPDKVDVYVGKRLRAQRKHLNLSQEQLARAVGVTFQQIQKYERGANRISASRLFDIAKVLGVPINFFFDFIEEDLGDRPIPAIEGMSETPVPRIDDPATRTETLDLVTAFWRLPNDEIRRKSLTLLKAMSGLRDKKGEPLPDED